MRQEGGGQERIEIERYAGTGKAGVGEESGT